MNRGTLYATIFLVTFVFSCKEPVDLFVPSTDLNILSVDGFISTDPGPHKILVTRSLPFENESIFKINAVVDADIKVIDNEGNCTDLDNQLDGFYYTPSSFKAIEGKSYQLVIFTDTKEYRSEFEKVPPPITIDSLYFKEKLIDILVEGEVVEHQVVEYYLDFTMPSDTAFGALNWTGDYIHSTRFPSGNIPLTCYGGDGRSGFSAMITTSAINSRSIKKFPFQKLNVNFKLEERHIMDVEIYSTSKKAYSFYQKVQNQLESTGSAFDPGPNQINGSYKSISDPDELIFGHFAAFNVSKKRVYFNISDLETRHIDRCFMAFPPTYCYDCRLLGLDISVTPPEDWEP